MDILIPTIGSSGDVYPLLTLGEALSKRGHQVTVVANQVFKDTVIECGLNFIQLGDLSSYEAVLSDPDLWHPQRAFNLIARQFVLPSIRPLFSAIEQFDPQNTLVLACGFCFGARLAQEKWGYPTLSLHLQPAVFQSAYTPPKIANLSFPDWLPVPITKAALGALDRFITDPVLAPELNLFREQLYLQPVQSVFSHWMHSLEGVIGLFPEWFAAPQSDWPVNTELTGFIGNRHADTPLSKGLVDFLEFGEAPVIFTAGTSMRFARSFFEQSIEACRILDIRGVFIASDPFQIPDDLPDRILYVPFAPFQTLLKKSLAIVHHGGIGTLAQALNAGIPQLITPYSHDQPDNAERIFQLGVGDRITPKHYQGKLAAKKIANLLDSKDVRRMTRVIAEWIDFSESLNTTCQLIEMHLPERLKK